MMDNFSDEARNVLAIAERQARHFNHEYVGTEHILLAIVDDECGNCRGGASSLGICGRVEVRDEIEQARPGREAVNARKDLPLTPRAKQAIEFARRGSAILVAEARWGGTSLRWAGARAGRRGGAGAAKSWAQTAGACPRSSQKSCRANEDRRTGRAASAGRNAVQAQNARGTAGASDGYLRARDVPAARFERGHWKKPLDGSAIRASCRVSCRPPCPTTSASVIGWSAGSHGGRPESIGAVFAAAGKSVVLCCCWSYWAWSASESFCAMAG